MCTHSLGYFDIISKMYYFSLFDTFIFCNYKIKLQKFKSFLQGSVFSLYLHDAVYMYALATDELFKEGGYKRNGSRIFEIAKNKTFEGKTALEQIFYVLILLNFFVFRKDLPTPTRLTCNIMFFDIPTWISSAFFFLISHWRTFSPNYL